MPGVSLRRHASVGAAAQFEVEDRGGERGERRGEHADDDPDDDADAGAGGVGDALDDDADGADEDVEHEDHAEHLPAVAAHELATAGERGEHAGALEHDYWRGDGPDGDEDQPGNDDEDEAVVDDGPNVNDGPLLGMGNVGYPFSLAISCSAPLVGSVTTNTRSAASFTPKRSSKYCFKIRKAMAGSDCLRSGREFQFRLS